MKREQGKRRFVFLVAFFAIICTLGIWNKSVASAATKYPYLIKVNKQQNTVTVYKKDSKGKYTVPVKAMVCSTGKATPTGTFKTQNKYRWKLLYHDVWGQYSTRITGSILFHSVYYYTKSPSDLAWSQYNKLGTTASMGCVRLTVADAKWIYDNCSVGTTVTIYNSSNPGPLGKPTAIKLKSGTKWDPTDTTNSKNPFNSKKPTITCSSKVTVAYGAKVNLKSKVTAKNTTGFDITSKIKVSGTVNTKKAGTYTITYSVTDELGRTAKKKVTYTVKADTSAPVLSGVKDKVVASTYNDSNILTVAKEGVTAKVNNKTLSSSLIKCSYTVLSNTSSAKKYKITYSVTNPSNKKTTTKTATITVDKKAPTISGLSAKYYNVTDFNTFRTNLSTAAWNGVTVSDNITASGSIKKSVSIDLTDSSKNIYTVTYIAKDAAGNQAKSTSKVYLLKNCALNASDQDEAEESDLTKEELLKKVTFTASNQDFTKQFVSKITVNVATITEGESYKVTYSLKVGTGETIKKTVTYTLAQKESENESAKEEATVSDTAVNSSSSTVTKEKVKETTEPTTSVEATSSPVEQAEIDEATATPSSTQKAVEEETNCIGE